MSDAQKDALAAVIRTLDTVPVIAAHLLLGSQPYAVKVRRWLTNEKDDHSHRQRI